MAYISGFKWKKAVGGTYAAAGIVIGGDDGVDLTNWRHHHGSDGTELIAPADVIATPSVRVRATDATKALAAYAWRASYPHGALTSDLILQFGDDDRTITVGENAAADDETACAIDEITFDWQEDGELEVEFKFVALGAKWASTGFSAAALSGTDKVYSDGMGVITIASAELAVVGSQYSHRNGLSTRAPADTRVASQKRWPTIIEQGIAENQWNVTALIDHDADLDGDVPTHAVSGTQVWNNGATTMTLTMSNGGLKHAPITMRERADGRLERQFEIDMAQNAMALT